MTGGGPAGRIFNVQRFSLHDGPGIRTTVFLKGCPLACAWCHNPEGQAPDPELVLDETRCVRCGACAATCTHGTDPARCTRCGACAEVCPSGARQVAGRDMTVHELVADVLRDRVFHEESGGGVTFSGGEPLAQPAFLVAALRALRRHGVHTTIDTCGFADRDTLLEAAALADLVLYDVKFVDDERHRAFTGVGNAPILDNLRALGSAHPRIWLRVPVVPGVNDGSDNVEATAALAAAIAGVRRVQLLPYHRAGARKFARIGRDYPLPDVQPPDGARMAELASIFRARGLDTGIGG